MIPDDERPFCVRHSGKLNEGNGGLYCVRLWMHVPAAKLYNELKPFVCAERGSQREGAAISTGIGTLQVEGTTALHYVQHVKSFLLPMVWYRSASGARAPAQVGTRDCPLATPGQCVLVRIVW